MYEEMARSSGLRTSWMHSQPPPGAHLRSALTVDGGARPGCLSKTECVYATSLVEIGDSAFYGSGLQGTLVIPAKLTTIGS